MAIQIQKTVISNLYLHDLGEPIRWLQLVQKWSSVLLASYGLALLLGSRGYIPNPFIVNALIIGFTAAVGYFCDKYRTRKAPLVCGFIAMALATVLFISASNIWVLLLARVCQGLSGAVVGVLGLSMIAETSSPEHLGSHMACGSASLTWGMLCGPMTGGFLYVLWHPHPIDDRNWQSRFSRFGTVGAFGVPMALLVVDIVLRMLIVQEDEGPSLVFFMLLDANKKRDRWNKIPSAGGFSSLGQCLWEYFVELLPFLASNHAGVGIFCPRHFFHSICHWNGTSHLPWYEEYHS